ncbi:hypothetical protein [Chloroflexus sp.]|uniref:hypothetical protein n=1 Tax=Chloroflexus sp. TaxID=1904827 RepID=UPI00298EDED1|nr:hypothetical protein [Chloroflexus sp.]MDW8403593.1 hypothetical protein [Chloroflexus sp.]
MIKASQLIPYRTASDDYDHTEHLKAKFAQLRSERHPLHLTPEEFDEILHWKLIGQYGKQKEKTKVKYERDYTDSNECSVFYHSLR